MKFKIGRYGIDVVPETDEDTAYIEDTLGLKKNGDWIPLMRKNAYNLSGMGLLETTRQEEVVRLEKKKDA